MQFTSHWSETVKFHFSDQIGAMVQGAFDGTTVRWLGFKFDDGGRAEVRIDGNVVAIVDQYGPGRNLPFDWSVGDLSPGHHTIQLKILAEKSPQSKGRFINVAGFE
jgi:hypothetical protein